MIGPLAEVFEELSDGRHNQGKWHPMGLTLTVVFLAILSGEQGIRGIASWVQEQRWRLGRAFKRKNYRLPSYGTIRRVLATVDVEELEQQLGAWAQEAVPTLTGEAWSGIAIDGITVRGSAAGEQPALHLLSAFSHQLSVVLGQRAVDGKTNEIPELPRLLEQLTLEGKVVTVDALHTQRTTAQAILEKKGPI
jgi:hypothetical protein